MIRRMAAQDAPQLLRLWLEGNLDAHPFVPAAYWEGNAPLVAAQLAQAEVWVWEDGGRVQGFAGLQGDYLAGIFVARGARSQGVGRALLGAVKAAHPAFTLQVYAKNEAALRFYLREGLRIEAAGRDEDTGEAEYRLAWPGLALLRAQPALAGQAAAWFAEKWGVPEAAYRESMAACAAQPAGVPQWYVLRGEGGRILAGAGVIDNDFHDRPDLAPNLCALYVEPPLRGHGQARRLLDFARQDLGRMGVPTLYLVTDHTEFYEKCGWQFLTLVQGEDGQPIRMYAADCARPEEQA